MKWIKYHFFFTILQKSIVLFAFLTVGQCLFFNTFLSAQIIYVNQTAIGNADGSSWENAFTDLQDGLLQAQIGDSVWVATGTYFPTNTDNREVSFVLKNGVKLFGGFSGTEMSLGERDWLAYPTVLSGDIGTPGDSTDNTYTILYMEGVDSTTQADGVFFISATADGDGGADSPTTCGGAVYINGVDAEAVPKIWNCNFERNYAKNDGGAVFVNGKANGSVAPQFYRCNFVGNKAGVAGGAIARIGGSWTETKKDFWECNFESNTASQFGGAIYYLESERLDTIELIGCNFIGNKSGVKGGGLLFDGGRITGSSIIFEGCLFEKNSFNLSGGINFVNSNSQRIKYVMIRNCEFKDDLNSLIEAVDNTGGLTELNIESTKFSNGYFSFRGDNNSTILNINHVEVSDGNSGTLWLAAFKEININDLKFIGMQDGFGSSLIVLENSGRVKCTNSLFVNNDVLANEGIWLRNNLFGPYGVTDTLIGCVFKNQVFSNPVDGIALANLYIANSIIVDDPSHGNLLAFNVDTLKIENSLITSAECPSFSPDPASNFFPPHFICGEGVVFGTDPMFLDTAAGDFRLHPCSPARNAGDNGIVNQLGLLTDIGGGTRVLEGTVDMGAYETPAFDVLLTGTTDVGCHGESSGSATIEAVSGCGPFTLAFGGASTFTDTLPFVLDGLPAISFPVTVTDSDGRSGEVLVSIESPAPLAAAVSSTGVDCAGGTFGAAAATASGGTAPYLFGWGSGVTGDSTSGLPVGNYTLTITDSLGCTATAPFLIEANGVLPVTMDSTAISCHPANGNSSDGTATAVADGIAPYDWQWQGGQATETIGMLGAGTYSATVTDALGCTGTGSVTLATPAPIDLGIDAPGTVCFGAADGTATATAGGGTQPYSFQWENGPAGPVYVGVGAGSYALTVTDSLGCTARDTVEILENTPVQLDTLIGHATGPMQPDGNITVSNVVGGTAPYTYLWVTGDTTPSLGGIPPGEYALSVTDSLGCETVFTFLVDFEVAAGELLEGVALTFLPNPVAAGGDMTLHIGGAAATTVTARLLDVAGRQAWSKVLEIKAGGDSFGFVAPSIPGIYWLVLEDITSGQAVLKWIVH